MKSSLNGQNSTQDNTKSENSVSDNYKFQQKAFKWSISSHRKFCIICFSLGWDGLTPKQIQKFLPDISRFTLSKHLNDTRKTIQYESLDFDSLPQQYQQDQVFIDIITYWQINKSRLPDCSIRKMINSE
ncbi:Conserved_hypothetical protein [Hexamita inflata]|uniref:Uncharacterized protein n=1 Tax=Hexamita inflata TaxID=28002 RepID=A0ABP1HG26_9EUKA